MQVLEKLLPSSPSSNWTSHLSQHIKEHPFIAWGLIISALSVALLLTQSIWLLASDQSNTFTNWGLLGGLLGFVATAAGALPAFFLRSISQQTEDGMLGFAAGMMLAACAFSLLLPGIEAGETITGYKGLGVSIVVFGMLLGVMLMLGLDKFTPHEHPQVGPCGPGHETCKQVWLFVFAIALHNLPEGMAIGVSFANGDLSVGLPLTSAIAIQDVPEGLAVALAIIAAGYKPSTAISIAVLSGLLEPVGALIGVTLSSGMEAAYPIGLGLAAGAMLFVVSHEVIPETHQNGHQTTATLGLMLGFALMMTLDTALA